MTIKEAYIEQLKKYLNTYNNLRCEGYYQTKIEFGGKSFYVSPDGSDVVRNVFKVDGCKKTRTIFKNNKPVKKVTFHKDLLPVTGTITKNTRFKKFIYKYVLFLRCDGVNDKDLIKFYVLQCICKKFEFRRLKKSNSFKGWEVYTPDYEDINVMLDGIISSAIKKEIDDDTRNQFIVKTKCVVNPIAPGNRNKTRKEFLLDSHRAVKNSTDNRINSLYDPKLTDSDNAVKCNVSLRRFKQWKKDNVESPKDRIKRLYDPEKSVSENAKICGVSESSIQRYKRTIKTVEIVEEVDDVDSWINSVLNDYYGSESDSDYTVHSDIDDDEISELLDKIYDDYDRNNI